MQLFVDLVEYNIGIDVAGNRRTEAPCAKDFHREPAVRDTNLRCIEFHLEEKKLFEFARDASRLKICDVVEKRVLFM